MIRNTMPKGLGGVMMAVALAAGYAATASAADDRPALTVAVNELPRSLDPGIDTGNVDVRVYYNVFDTLIRRDFNPKPGGPVLVPGLATSWTRPQPNVLELTLRQGVKCHDGKPFNADDVMVTFAPERIWGKDAYYRKGREYFAHFTKVEKVDDFKVRITTKGPDIALEHLLSSYASFIVCDEALNAFKTGDDYKAWMDKAAAAMKWNPVGTGPYKAGSYQKDDHVTLVSNDDYWGGKPAAKSVTFKEVPEVAGRIAGLVSGEYDIIVEVTPDQWEALDKYKDIIQKPTPIENTHIVAFNTADPVMSSKKLRQAMSLAIDRKALIDSLWHGKTSTPKGHQLEAYGPMYDASRKGYVYDLDLAKKLVVESGYKGERISYRVIPNYYIYNVEAAQILQEMWRKIGVNVEIEFVDSFNEVRAKGVQAFAWSNTYRIPDPVGALLPLWGPESPTQKTYKFFNPGAEFNELADKLLGDTDMTTRKAHFVRMLDILEDDMPFTMLYNPVTTYAMKKTVAWEPDSLYYMDFRPDNFSYKK
jgi:peptide/nickel transport system substrate-binding protein